MARFINIGHRGAAAYVHENSIASFEEAIRLKADMIEFDIRKTLDGVLVVFHDRTIKVQDGHRKPISKMTFNELVQATSDMAFTPPRLEDVLRLFGHRIPMNMEVKVGGIEPDVTELLSRYPPAFAPVLSSFLPWIISRAKGLNGDLRTAIIIGHDRVLKFLDGPVWHGLKGRLKLNAIHIRNTLASQEVIENIRNQGLGLFVWTVDSPSEMRRFISMGVDGIITNKPDVLYNVCLELSSMNRPILKEISNTYGRFAYAV